MNSAPPHSAVRGVWASSLVRLTIDRLHLHAEVHSVGVETGHLGKVHLVEPVDLDAVGFESVGIGVTPGAEDGPASCQVKWEIL